MNNEFWLDWDRYDVADTTKSAFENYFLRGLPPGSFVTAVICNNFVDAVCKADAWNSEQGRLKTIAKWLYNNAPAKAWGSRSAYKDWMNNVDGCRTKFFDNHSKKQVWKILEQV